jgi:hypothetical protein
MNKRFADLVSQQIAIAYPAKYAALQSLSPKHTNLHEMIAYLMAHPEKYDLAMRTNLFKIIKGLPALVPAINQSVSKQ